MAVRELAQTTSLSQVAEEKPKKVKTGKAKPGAGKPQPAWGMVSISLVAIAAGALVAKAIGADPGKGVIEAGAVLVAWAGLLVAAEKRLTASLGMGLLVVLMMLVAWATSGNGVAAGLVTGSIMFLSALAARQTGKMSTVGSIAGTIYFLFAVLGIVRGLSATEVAETSAIGFLIGFALIAILHFTEITIFPRLIEPRRTSGKDSKGNEAAVTRFFARGPGMRYALARGILLGVGMGLYQADRNSNVFWVMIAVWVVLQPAPLATWDKAIRRGIGTLVGCLAVGAVAYFVSGEALTLIAFGLFLIGLAYYPVDYRIFITTMSFLVVTIYGGATEQGVVHWGLLRILDNAIGIGISFIAAFWVVPRWGVGVRWASRLVSRPRRTDKGN